MAWLWKQGRPRLLTVLGVGVLVWCAKIRLLSHPRFLNGQNTCHAVYPWTAALRGRIRLGKPIRRLLQA